MSVLAVIEVPDSDLAVLSSGDDEGSLGRGGQSVDVSVVGSEGVLDLEGLRVPDFESSVPSGGGEERVGEVTLGDVSSEEGDAGDPIGVVVLGGRGESAGSLDVPELDNSVGSTGDDLSVVRREGA